MPESVQEEISPGIINGEKWKSRCTNLKEFNYNLVLTLSPAEGSHFGEVVMSPLDTVQTKAVLTVKLDILFWVLLLRRCPRQIL